MLECLLPRNTMDVPASLRVTLEVPLEPHFRVVDANVLKHRKLRTLDEEDVIQCSCRDSDGDICASNKCPNKATRVECLVGFCSKTRCKNMRLQRKEYARTKVVDAGVKGRGLVAAGVIKAGTLICEYTGEVLSEAERERRMQLYSAAGGHFYIMGIGRKEYLDAARYGNHMRYMNHSCTPNA